MISSRFLGGIAIPLPEIDLKEMEEEKERNRQERLKFIELYAEWVKKTPNEVWSKQQKELIDG